MVLDAGRYGPLWLMPFPIISQYVDTCSWVYAVIEYNHASNKYSSQTSRGKGPKNRGC